MSDILQNALPQAPWSKPQTWRMPGTQALDPATWLVVDDAFGAQMTLRETLIETRLGEVHDLRPEGRAAAVECLDHVLAFLALQPAYRVADNAILRPDGVEVAVDRDAPLVTLGRLIQEDICLMQPGPDGHILTGAMLCFPASWTLEEKIGRPLVRIHRTVPKYDVDTARRVQRLFDGIQVGRPMWRANAHLSASPALFAPKREADTDRAQGSDARYLRSERQTLMRLPLSGAVVFGIHTYMVRIEDLTDVQRAGFQAARRTSAG